VNKWIVIPGDDSNFGYFKTLQEAREFVQGLIKKAEQELGDLEGHWPSWIEDTVIVEIKYDVVPDQFAGMKIRELK